MKQTNRSRAINFISWLFLIAVLTEAIYSGIKFGCWMGLAVLIIGIVGGIVYAGFSHKL